MDNLPQPSKSGKIIAVAIIFFLLGAGVGVGGSYLYGTKVLLPKYQKEMESAKNQWETFFKQGGGEEYNNPFGTGTTGETTEEYVNPFDLIGQ